MPSPNITKPLIGLQNWVANQVKEEPILEKRIKLPFGTDAMRGTGTQKKKVKQYFKPHMARGLEGGEQKFDVSVDRETGESEPPGPPPAGREHLKWNPKTHRWIDPEGQAQEARSAKISADETERQRSSGVKPKQQGFLRRKTDKEMRGTLVGRAISDLTKKGNFDMDSQLFKDFVKKAILDKQPGPPPREGLRWKSQTHRWIRPKEQVSQLGTGGKYSPELAEQQRPALQQIMNDRVARAETELGEYEIGQNMSTFDKLHNEVMLGDTEEFGGKSVFEQAGIDTENLSPEAEEHLYDFMDTITEAAMEHNEIENIYPDDEDEDEEGDY